MLLFIKFAMKYELFTVVFGYWFCIKFGLLLLVCIKFGYWFVLSLATGFVLSLATGLY